MDVELQHRIAWTLYQCEAARAERVGKVLSEAAGRDIRGAAMEPWEEAKETYLSDAAAVLAAIEAPSA